MARLRRLLLTGHAHLLRQRGHNGQPIVVDEQDAASWRELLRDAAISHRVSLHAWALRSDGFDLVATPSTAEGLGRMMQSLARRHAAAFNRRHARSGTLWDGRYACCLLDPKHWVTDAMVAVETAAWADAAAGEPGSPSWGSSLQHHLGHLRDPIVTEPSAWWELGNTPFDREANWRQRTAQGLTAQRTSRLEAALRRGWPLGEPAFLKGLAKAWGALPAPRARGRPRKAGAPPIG